MAPITRSSQFGRSAALPQASRHTPIGESPDHSEESFDEPEGTEEEELSDAQSDDDPFTQNRESFMASPNTFGTTSAQQFLQPLRQTADRVSRQVEEFAKCLDKFNASRNTSEQELWLNARQLADKFADIAIARRKQTTSGILGSRSSSRSRQTKIEAGETEEQQVQLEADLWSLVAGLLLFDSPDETAKTVANRKASLHGLHRYSTNSDIWNAFLATDQFARECQEILRWLQRVAAASKTSIGDVTASLTLQAQQGDGIWSAGWLYTKFAIKAQKRSRSWPKPLEPDNPGIAVSHVRGTDSKPLVTQMDPDARSREGNALQPQDEFREQAAWLTCWELLRRGKSPEDIRSWWSERKEVWRALSIRGLGSKTTEDESTPWSRVIHLPSNSEWFSKCKALCQDGADVDKYQSAVYGVLCGDMHSPIKACSTIDDNLFVYFNAFLVQRYKEFIQVYQQQMEKHRKLAYHPQPSTYDYIRKYLVFSQHDETTYDESRKSHKVIEAAIVSKDYQAFFIRQGQALAQKAKNAGQFSHLIEADQSGSSDDCARIASEDPEALRIITHLQLLLKSLGYLQVGYDEHTEILENNVSGYIGWLQQAGKLALIPLYASTLSPGRAAKVLAAVFIEVMDPKERELQIKLIKQYGMDVNHVLWTQFDTTNSNILRSIMSDGMQVNPTRITESVGPGKVKHIKIKSHFIGNEISDEEELAIRTLEWFRYGDGQKWDKACVGAAILYQVFISKGRLAAARDLSVRASLGEISSAALKINVSNLDERAQASEDEDMEMDGVPAEERTQRISPAKKHKESRRPEFFAARSPENNRQILVSMAHSWRQLEQLVMALDALERWNDVAEEVERHRNDSAQIRVMKQALRETLHDVRLAMLPLLEEDYLSKPLDEAEVGPLMAIRNHYLPDCVLAFNSVLYFAGHAITRSWLVECMNLAQVVATNQTLTEAFVASGRMRELVTAFAWSSQALLHANEAGGKKGRRDEGVDIWQVKLEHAADKYAGE